MSLKIGLVGCGRWGRLILRDLRSLGAEVHVVCRSEETAQRALGQGAAAAGTAFGDEPLDAYVVATPTISHAEAIFSLLETGKPIFVEKPITADRDSAKQILEAAGERVFVMDKWRYHPGIERMRSELASGDYGEALALVMSRKHWWSPHDDVPAHWILLPHDLAIALHVLGETPDFESAYPFIPSQPDLGAQSLFKTTTGVSCHIEYSVASPEYRRSCLLLCSQGALELRGGYETQLFYRRGAPASAAADEGALPLSDEMPLLAELQRFVDYVKGAGPAPLSSAAEAFEVVDRIVSFESALYGG